MTTDRPMRRGALPLAMLVAAAVLFAGEPLPAAPPPGRLLLRNDGVALKPELSLGRFGAGRLFFDRPADVGIDDDGNAFVLDIGNNRVQVLDEDGKFRSQWALKADARASRDRPAALAVNRRDGAVFFLDGEAAVVQQYGADGRLVASFGRIGLSTGRMDKPIDLDVDPFGYIYVLDRGRNKVLKWNQKGSFVAEWGEPGSRDGQFADPVSIAFSPEGLGAICVLDRGRRSLLLFSRDGGFLSAEDLSAILPADGPSEPRLAVADDGTVFIVEGTNGKLIKSDKRAVNVFSFEPLSEAGGIAVDDHNGRLYATDRKAHRLLRFTLEMN